DDSIRLTSTHVSPLVGGLELRGDRAGGIAMPSTPVMGPARPVPGLEYPQAPGRAFDRGSAGRSPLGNCTPSYFSSSSPAGPCFTGAAAGCLELNSQARTWSVTALSRSSLMRSR